MYERTLYYGREGAVIQAMAGIDLALWDIKGKALQQPVWKLLGGRHRDRLRVYASNMFQFTCVEPSEISRRLIRNPIRLEDGQMRVPEEPGLGVEPDMAVVEKYLVRN
jgi:L-alanine-DL-glutamate epimerase-like enolase superfamily enzyme